MYLLYKYCAVLYLLIFQMYKIFLGKKSETGAHIPWDDAAKPLFSSEKRKEKNDGN